MPEPGGLRDVAWEPCALTRQPDPEITRYVRRHVGFVPDHLDYLTVAPWVARQVVHWDASSVPLLELPVDLVEMISLVVAQDNSCRYCYAATTAMLRALGIDDHTIRALEQDLAAGTLPVTYRLAVDFGRRFSRANPLLGPDALAPLRAAGFGEHALREIVYVAAIDVLANRVITLAAVPVDGIERMSRRWWLRLLGPILRVNARRTRRRARAESPSVARWDGPFRDVVQAFEGHPLAPILWTQIDEAWRSAILPRRTKALVVGVVGRALGCVRSEAEAARQLAADGESLDLAAVLANLASPELTEAEAVIVPFARETAHYTPAQIQRRGRLVYERLGQAAFLEAVGIAALANALCRVTAVLAAPPA